MNPLSDWWKAYAPSSEEVAAAEKGYNFKDAKAWFEERGIDYEKALAETKVC